MSLQEYSLWNASVFNSWLDDVDRVVIKIVKDDALANSEILIFILNDWFLEVSMES